MIKFTKKQLNYFLIVVLATLLVLIFWPRSTSLSASINSNQPYIFTDEASFTATFTSPIKEKQQSQIKLKSNPSANWQLNWTSDTQVILASNNLSPDTIYTLDLIYKGQSVGTHVFTSSSQNKQQFLETTAQQAKDDYQSGQVFEALHQDYPWYSSIPITDPNFRIIYDFNLESFRIRLLKQPTPEIKQQALKAIQAIGADLDKYNHYFIEPNDNFQQLLNQ